MSGHRYMFGYWNVYLKYYETFGRMAANLRYAFLIGLIVVVFRHSQFK